MQVGYSCLRKRFAALSKQLMVMCGLLVLPVTMKLEKKAAGAPVPSKPPQQPTSCDPRAVRLRSFLGRLHCPVVTLAEDFVHAADDNNLDWRLLPSISVIESGGGKAYKNNNIFGWNNGDEPFPTLRAGLTTVAYKLGNSPLYKNRDVVGKLRIYNPDETYADKVLTVMKRISPAVNLRNVSSATRMRYAYTN